jgi:hypothetical protein
MQNSSLAFLVYKVRQKISCRLPSNFCAASFIGERLIFSWVGSFRVFQLTLHSISADKSAFIPVDVGGGNQGTKKGDLDIDLGESLHLFFSTSDHFR